jgi:hypothetical protein
LHLQSIQTLVRLQLIRYHIQGLTGELSRKNPEKVRNGNKENTPEKVEFIPEKIGMQTG